MQQMLCRHGRPCICGLSESCRSCGNCFGAYDIYDESMRNMDYLSSMGAIECDACLYGRHQMYAKFGWGLACGALVGSVYDC